MANPTKQTDLQYVANTYGRFDVALASAQGATYTDEAGKAYIDLGTGIGVTAFGAGDPEWVAAVTAQLHKIQHFSNYFYCESASVLAEKLVSLSGLKRVFFGNSGAEANEGAIKLARKYSFDKYGEGRATVITLENSFHGRTVTTLAATGQDVFHNFFFPFTGGFKYAEANSIEALHEAFDDSVCAVMVEMIQGEGGVVPLDKD